MNESLRDGLYDELLSHKKNKIINNEEFVSQLQEVDPAEFSSYAAAYIERHLKIAIENIKEDDRVEEGLKMCNALIDHISKHSNLFSEDDLATNQLLLSLLRKGNTAFDADNEQLTPPGIPLSQSALLVNARDEYRIGTELKKEINSANRIDLICSFIKWSGLRLVKEELKNRIDKGVEVRVITTVYMGASDKRAIDELHDMGANVKVSYDTRRTRLHAKAWHFFRESGYSTAYVGSSNLSASAQTDGLEWNVRLSKRENPHLIEKFEASFESYWNSEEFRSYEKNEEEEKRLSTALNKEATPDFDFTFFDITPYPFQKEILEKLAIEREVKNRNKNLVVAATGTGKTVISAFDFKNYMKEVGKTPNLLFVAHRKEILTQSLQTFRQVLTDANFGELLVDKYRPTEWQHVFASIQSLNAQNFNFDPDRYEVIIVDEFHHAEADTYQKLLEHANPTYLLGLTATPERSDGINVIDWFHGRASAELRVWDAIEKGLLAPFQYFGVHDNTDLSDVGWTRGQYNVKELEEKYTSSKERLSYILKEVKDKITDPHHMHALGFCVSVQHAEFMSEKFNEAGIPSKALSGETHRDNRRNCVSQLRKGEINVIFTVDVFNEGVDIPEVDTVLFLRPTDSATLFTQQLGRGLRLQEGKECLTCLDFIGHSHKNFSFANKFQALSNQHGRKLIRHIEQQFPVLPTGCAIELDKVSQEIVLENIRSSVSQSKRKILSHFKNVSKPDTLKEFLRKTELRLDDLYRNGYYFTQLKREAALIDGEQTKEEETFGRALTRSIHIDSIQRLSFYSKFFASNTVPDINSLNTLERKFVEMWASIFGEVNEIGDLKQVLQRFWNYSELVKEFRELVQILMDNVSHKTLPWENEFEVPLEIHARYSRNEIFAAFEEVRDGRLYNAPGLGVYFNKRTQCNLLFVTINKSEKDYSPSTMYKDYAISETLFHWQSQSNTRPETLKGKRHIHHKNQGITPLLFLRASKKDDRGETEPYFFAGSLELEKWEGEQPMDVVWKVEEPLPADMYKQSAINFN